MLIHVVALMLDYGFSNKQQNKFPLNNLCGQRDLKASMLACVICMPLYTYSEMNSALMNELNWPDQSVDSLVYTFYLILTVWLNQWDENSPYIQNLSYTCSYLKQHFVKVKW